MKGRYKFILSILLVTGILISALAFYIKKNEEALIKDALMSINTELKQDLIIEGSTKFKLFKHFPMLSLELEKVELGNLFKAHKLSLLIPVFDIIKGNYNIEEIIIDEGRLNFIKDGKKNNYEIFKNESKKTKTVLNINKIKLKASSFSLRTLNQSIDFSNLNLTSQMRLNDSLLRAEFEFSCQSDTLSISKQSYLKNKDLTISGDLEYFIKKDSLNFNESSLFVLNETYEANGGIAHKQNEFIVDLYFEGNDLKAQNVHSLMQALNIDLEQGKYLTGDVDIKLDVDGTPNIPNAIKIESEIKLKNGKYEEYESIDDINLKGHYIFSDESRFTIHESNCKWHNESITATGVISGKSNLNINIEAFGHVPRSFLNIYTKESGYDVKEALIKLNPIKIEATLSEDNGNQIDYIKANAHFDIQNLFVSSKGNQFHDVQGELTTENDNLKINLAGQLEDSKFIFDGQLNAFNEIIKLAYNQNITASNLNLIGKLNIDRFNYQSEEINEDELEAFDISHYPNIDFTIDISQLTYDDFNAENVKLNMIKADNSIEFKNFKATGLDGDIGMTLNINQNNELNSNISGHLSLKTINLNDLFKSFHNFEQSLLSHEHLKGSITTNFEFECKANEYLELDLNSLILAGPYEIQNGELIAFEPLMDLNAYLSDNKLISKFLKVKEFDHIRFGSIKNKLKIENENIFFDNLKINSNKAHVFVNGVHQFNNDINYKLKINIPSILNKGKIKSEDYIVIEDQGMNLFLVAEGNIEDPIIKYDKRQVKEVIKENIKKEKTILKGLNKEKALSKQDSIKMSQPDIEEESLDFEDEIDW